MREIKFRAWYKGSQFPLDENDLLESEKPKMYYDVHKVYDSGTLGEGSFGSFLDNDDYIVEQFTGLHDKNGKKIYEGDIVKWFGQEVENGKQVYPVRTHVIGGDNNKWVNDLYILRNIISMQEVEIIGNIHENPELINER